MPRPKRRKPLLSRQIQSSNIEDTLDDLTMFQEWREKILPELREMIIKGVSAKEIYAKYGNYAAARAVTIAITETDSTKALAAIKDIQDRSLGKPTETKKIQHELQELSDEQLDALLYSENQEEEMLELIDEGDCDENGGNTGDLQ